jgi:ribosomal protein S18 acetylase RimI-like enzyme
MSKVAIKSAEDSVLASLTLLFNSSDYLYKAWPIWFQQSDAVNLIAEVNGRTVGCVHGEFLTEKDAWAQGLRVHRDFRNFNIGTQLLMAVVDKLKLKGAKIVRGTIDVNNHLSRSLVRKVGFREVGEICRRLGRGHGFNSRQSSKVDFGDALNLVQALPVLASRPHMSYVYRSYFSMNEKYLCNLVKKKLFFTAKNSQAFAIIEQGSSPFARDVWVTALRGDVSGKIELLGQLFDIAHRKKTNLVVDSQVETEIQAFLDRLNFEAPSRLGRFIVIECRF